MTRSSLTKPFLIAILFIGSLTILPNTAFCWIIFTLNPQYIPADGETSCDVPARIIDFGGNRAGCPVYFSIKSGTGSVPTEPVLTDSDGIAHTTYTPSDATPQKVEILATSIIQVPAEGGGTIPQDIGGIGCVILVKVTFSPNPIDVGTDGIGVTTYSGESKNVTVLIQPDNVTLDFGMADSSQASVSPTSGHGEFTLTVTSISDQDTSLNALKSIWILGSAPVRLHKPKRMEFVNVYNVPLPPGTYGDIEERHYSVYDFQNRLISVQGYYIEEFINMVENDDGSGNPYSQLPEAGSGPHPNSDLVDTLRFTFTSGTLDPGHEYKWNQRFEILGLDVENNLWKHDFRRIDDTHLEIDSYTGQW